MARRCPDAVDYAPGVRVAVYDRRSIVHKLKFPWPELKRCRRLPRAKKRRDFVAGSFDRRMMALHRDIGAAVLNPHRKAGGLMSERLGLVVIDFLAMSDAIMKRFDMWIIHDFAA